MYLVIIRVLLATLFLVAAIGNLLGGLTKSRKTLADFGVPLWLIGSMSIALPCAELSIACLLFPASSARIGAISALALLLAFNVAIGANLALGRMTNCNCFGQLHSAPIGWTTVRNSVLAAFAGWVVWQVQHQPSGSPLQAMQNLSGRDIFVTLLALLAFAAIGAEALVMLQLFRQNGRLLLRMEALEARLGLANVAVAAPAAPRGLPIGSPAPSFEFPNVQCGTATLEAFLPQGKKRTNGMVAGFHRTPAPYLQSTERLLVPFPLIPDMNTRLRRTRARQMTRVHARIVFAPTSWNGTSTLEVSYEP